MKKYIIHVFLVGSIFNFLSMQSSFQSHVAEQVSQYKKFLKTYFNFSNEEVRRVEYILPGVHPKTHMELNFAVMACKEDRVSEILQTQVIWNAETIKEALILLDYPYLVLVDKVAIIQPSSKIKDLLIAKLAK